MPQTASDTKARPIDQSCYAEIYAIADDARSAAVVASPARLTQRLWTAIDQLRTKAAPSEDIALAERTSLALHRYNLSRHSRTPMHGFALPDTADELSALADMWLRRLAHAIASSKQPTTAH